MCESTAAFSRNHGTIGIMSEKLTFDNLKFASEEKKTLSSIQQFLSYAVTEIFWNKSNDNNSSLFDFC
jgi:hypothetical protein